MSGESGEKQSVLLVDVGNRITRIGLAQGTELQFSWAITTPAALTIDEARGKIRAFWEALEAETGIQRISLGGIGSILSCVVPDVSSVWTAALSAACESRPLVVGPGLKTGIKMQYNDPAGLGSDRVASIVAAKSKYTCPVIIVDCDTIITYQVLDAEGVFVGGLITPGVSLSVETLAQAAARLPVIELDVHVKALGKNTRESMKSGIVLGEVARIEGLVAHISRELGEPAKLILTGDSAPLLAPLLKIESTVDEYLVLEGLRLLYSSNQR